MDFPKTRCLVNPEISHPVRASMTSEKSKNSYRNKKRDSAKNKSEKRATLKKNIFDTAVFECETRGSILEIMFRIRVNLRLCSCVYFFDSLLFSLFLDGLSFFRLTLLFLFEFIFFSTLFFVCSSNGDVTE